MTLRRLMIRIRITLIILFVVGAITVIGGILYLNHQGLNSEVRSMISKKLAEKGMHVEFDSLSYKLSSGLVAENVTIYADESKQSKIASLPSIHINLDKTKLLRGIHKINSLSLQDGHLEIPLDPAQPNGTRVVLDKINGDILFPDQSTIITDSLTASYEGIEIHFTGNLWLGKKPLGKPNPEAAKNRALAYERFLEKIAYWRWPADSPPTIDVFAEGDIYAPQHIKLEFKGKAKEITRKNFTMEELSIHGELSHNLVTVDSLKFENISKGERRAAELVGDFDLGSHAGRFQIKSDIHLKEFAKELFDREILKGTKFYKSVFSADGSFVLEKSMDEIPYASALPSFLTPYKGNQISLMGKAELIDFSHLGTDFDIITSDFSYDAGDLYLDDLLARNSAGFLKARLLIKDQKIRFDAESTLPVRSYKPFIKENTKLNEAISQIQFNLGSSCYFQSTGTINADDLTDWDATGKVSLKKITCADTCKINELETTFQWKNKFLTSQLKIAGLQHGKIKIEDIATKLKWHQGILSLQDTEIEKKNIFIGEINTNVKEVDGKLSGNLTLKDANLNGFVFEQLDTKLQTVDNGVTGKIHITKPVFRDQVLDHLKLNFLYKDQITLNAIEIKHPSGTIKGNAHQAKDGYIYYDVVSTVHPHLFVPLVKYENTKQLILSGGFNKKSKHLVTAKGRINPRDPKDWNAVGKADLTHFTFNKVPLTRMVSKYDLTPKRMVMDENYLGFDYTNYSMRNSASSKQQTGELKVDRVVIDTVDKTVMLDNIYGKAYPAPAARMFNKASADHLEQYKFYAPPEIRAGGTFDIIPRPLAEQKMDFRCNLACPKGTLMYSILDGNVLLKNFKANVRIHKNSVQVNKISCTSFRGAVKGQIKANISDATYSGNLSFLKLNFKDLGITYNFDEIPQGELTGKIIFSGKANDIRNFNGTGNISLDKGNIFSAPVLGPISLILNPLLPKKGRISERLKNLSANFTINKGILRTDNIQSLTPSMTFTGAGWIDFKTEKMDITIRINYRGLLGMTMQLGAEIIRMPVHMLRALFLNKKPGVAGLLQVRGTGNYKKPKWRPVQFDIDRGFKGKLFNPPKAVIVP